MGKPGNKKKVAETSLSLALSPIFPLTTHQQETFHAWQNGQHLVLSGDAGTGKTFISLYLALRQVLKKDSEYTHAMIIRSIVPSREVGYLPGSLKEKIGVYEDPYRYICNQLLSRGDGYEILKSKFQLSFQTTSYLRGVTFEDCIIVIDEIQNLSYGELSTVITRMGKNCRLILCGDVKQSDLWRVEERNGVHHMLSILSHMDSVTTVNFDVQDVVRSGFVKDFLLAQDAYRKDHQYCAT